MEKQLRVAVALYKGNDYKITYSNDESSLWKQIGKIAYKNRFEPCEIIINDFANNKKAIVEITNEEKGKRVKTKIKLKEDSFYLDHNLYKARNFRLIDSSKDIRIKYDLNPNNLGKRTLNVGVITNNIGEEGLDRLEDGIVLHPFPSQLYRLNCYLKLLEGFKDYSEFLEKDEEEDKVKQFFKKPDEKEMEDSDAVELYKFLTDASKQFLKDVGIELDFYSNTSPYTKRQINSARKLYEKMLASSTIGEFNDFVDDFIAIANPKFKKGMTLNSFKVVGFKNLKEQEEMFKERIETIESIVLSMETVYSLNKKSTDKEDEILSPFGNVIVKKETPEEMDKTINGNNPKIDKKQRDKIIAVYDITPVDQEKKYNEYFKKLNKKEEKLLFHGSRNSNREGIIRNGLLISPAVGVLNGRAFGNGSYLAISSDKSAGYGSQIGSYWSKGDKEIAVMGIFATAYGNAYDPCDELIGGDPKDTKKLLDMFKKDGYDSLHYHGGKGSFIRDEIVVYNESATCLRKLILYKA